MGQSRGRRDYAAFISYSHSDEVFAGRLHRFIETWRTPRRLVGADGRDGPVPARLFPVFRDREELPTSADLGGVIRTALEASRYLVVLCSPRAAASRWVGEEIVEFKRMHGEGRIIACILEGEPADCFPEALKYRIGPDGTLTDVPTEPIAADFRPGKDGQRFGRLKILAGLLGVDLDALVQREAARRRVRRLSAAAVAAVAAIGAGVGITAWNDARALDAARALVARGAADLRAGATFEGAHRFLSGLAAMGSAAPPADAATAGDLRARLVPLAEALGELAEGAVFAWRGGAYLMRDGAPRRLPSGDVDRYAWAPDGALLLAAPGGGLSAFDPAGLALRWTSAFEPGEEVCGLWHDSASGRLYLEAQYVGMTIGASYGFRAWVDLATGARDSLGEGMLFQTVCTGDDQPREIEGDFSRLDDQVAPLAWPRLRREAAMWEPGDFAAVPPLLSPGETQAMRQRFYGLAGEETTPGVEVFPFGLSLAWACGDQTFVAGRSSTGMGGGEWLACRADGEGDFLCTEHDYAGAVNGFVAAPDCRMVVAWGAALTDRRGLMVALRDGSEGAVDGAERTGNAAIGAFSPSGARFAVTDGGGLIQVFSADESGLARIAAHDVGTPVALLTFLGEDRLALVTRDGVLVAIEVATGAAVWPAQRLGSAVAEAWRDDYDLAPPGFLAATAAGDRLVFGLRVEATGAYEMDPTLQPRLPDGSPAPAEEGRRASFVRLFDGTRGVPLGGRMSLSWTTPPDADADADDDLWSHAGLLRSADGALVLTYEPYAAFAVRRPDDVAVPLERLTGIGPNGALNRLPDAR